MWKMATTVSKELYDKGYWLEGEGNRVDVVAPTGKKCFEIFFLGKNDVRVRKVMEGKEHWKVEKIFEISIREDGTPQVKAAFSIC